MPVRTRFLLLLNEGEAAAPAPRESTFAERKAAQLREERAIAESREQPIEQETAESTPPSQEESVQDDGYPELHDGETQPELASDEESDLYDETPDELDTAAEGDEQTVDWEKRYLDTQAELSRLSGERKERDSELAEMMAGSLQLQYDMEDQLGKARQYTSYYVDGIQSQLGQLENAFRTGQIDPEHMAQARQQYQALQGQKQQMDARLSQIESTEAEAKKMKKQREAAITRVRLQRTIPDWSAEKYRQMGQEAQSRGYSEAEFNDITDHRFFEMLHDSIQLRSASETIGDVTKRKRPKPPRGRRNASSTPRNARGQFEKAKREFHENPNQKGRFAEMKAKELARERRGR